MSRAERLAFISPRFAAGATVGGAETLLRRLAERAVADGRHVDFLATCAENHFTWENSLPPGDKNIAGITVRYFPVNEDRDKELFFKIQSSIGRGKQITAEDEDVWIRNCVNSLELCEYLRTHGADYDRVIIGPYLFGLIHAVSQILPEKTLLVPCLHDEPFAYLDIMRKLFHRVAGCLFNTPPEQDLAGRLYELQKKRCAVVGMGLEPFDADPEAFSKRHKLSTPYLLYSGRRETGKGTPLLCDFVHAFRQRTGRDIRLVFTGSGPIEAPDALRPAILDVGFVSENEKHEAMAGALSFCHPSVYESLSIVLLEAWLARTPVLVHARSPVLQWQCQQSGGGLWFQNYPEFEEELTYLWDNPGMRRQLGESGRRYVLEMYAWDRVAARFFTALDTMGYSRS